MVHNSGQSFIGSAQSIGRPARHGVQVLLCVLLLFLHALAAEDVYLSNEEALKLAFPDAAQIREFNPSLNKEQARLVMSKAHARVRGKLENVYVASSNGTLDGIAFIDNAIGRTEFFTYCCALNSDGTIKRMDLLIYREPYGSEIRKRSWLGRFVGKDYSDQLKHKRDVPNLSGATMSCRGMVERVRFLLTYHDLVLQKQVQAWLAEQPVENTEKTAGKTTTAYERSVVIGEPLLRLSFPQQQEGAQDALKAAAGVGIAEAQRWNELINTWNPEAELSRCLARGRSETSPELAGFISAVFDWYKRTQHRVDPSIKPLLLYWQRCAKDNQTPDVERLKNVQELCGLNKATWDAAARRLELPAGMEWDVSALAKGWIVDRVYDALAEQNVAALIDYGQSSIRALGSAQEVAVRDPADPEQTLGVLHLKAGQALSSSGSYHRQWQIDDEHYSTFIDPQGGRPLSPRRAATVIAADALHADVLATAACIMDVDAALALIRTSGAEAMIWRDGELHCSAGMPALKQPE